MTKFDCIPGHLCVYYKVSQCGVFGVFVSGRLDFKNWLTGPFFIDRVDLKSDLHATLETERKVFALSLLVLFLCFIQARGVLPPEKAELPDFDARAGAGASGSNVTMEQHAALK